MPWRRRPFSGYDIGRALNVADLRDIARRRIPGFAFEYVESGAEDEVTLRGNREALERLRLIPRTLVDTSQRHLRTTILGSAASAPLVIAPTGLNGLLHPDGDVALARAAAKLGVPYTLSTVSTTRLEEVATRRWCSQPMPTCSAIASGTSAATAAPASRRCAPRSTRCVTRAGCGRYC